MIDLLQCRQELDEIDKQILELFEHRMDICEQVASYKVQTGKKVLDTKREKEKIDKVRELTVNPVYKKPAGELMKHLMSLSRKLQYNIVGASETIVDFERFESLHLDSDTKVVYYGVPGTHSEHAMINYFGEDVTRFGADTFSEVMEAVKNGEADYGVLPIENSSTGGIHDIFDLLLKYDNFIIDEIDLKIEQALLGVEGARLEDITKVYSHSQALMQCSKFLESNPKIAQYTYESTAASAKKVSEDNDITQAAIAGVRAAQTYGLKVLRECCNNNEYNKTRFIVIAAKPMYLAKANLISVCFEVPHVSGSLYSILSNFIFNDINMTKIESCPVQGKGWEYRFFVDIEGSINSASVKCALNAIKTESEYFKILGSYSDEQLIK